MGKDAMSRRDEFRNRLREIGVRGTEIISDEPRKLYVFADEGGYAITQDCYEGLDARLIESIGMESLSEDHRLFRCYASHVLIFKVE